MMIPLFPFLLSVIFIVVVILSVSNIEFVLAHRVSIWKCHH
jgi:hypothetical protein